MRALFDVNVWIALFDNDHTFSKRVNDWVTRERPTIATCPLIENGVVRIMASTGYSAMAKQSAADITAMLRKACTHGDHEFWPDDLTLRDAQVFDVTRLHGSRQITDAYLLALAIANSGRFVTLDGAIPLSAVRGATNKHLLVL